MRIHNRTDYDTKTLSRLAREIFRGYATPRYQLLTKHRKLIFTYWGQHTTSWKGTTPISQSVAFWGKPGKPPSWTIEMPAVGCRTDSLIRCLYWFATRGQVWQNTPLPWWPKLQEKYGYILWSIPKNPRE